MKTKLQDISGYLLFLLLLIVLGPLLFVSSGLLAIPRFYMYVDSKVHDKEPRKYNF